MSIDPATTLALAAGRGDREALAELIRTTQSEVWRFVAHLAGRGVADDLTQETYIKMLGALPDFQGSSSLRWWLLTIARRVVVDHRRRESVRPTLVGVDAWQIEAAAAPYVSPTADSVLYEAVDALPPERREALLLTQAMGYTYAEAAAIVGCPVGTVRSRVARARADLVAELATRPVAADR